MSLAKKKKILAACGSYAGIHVKKSMNFISKYQAIYNAMVTKPPSDRSKAGNLAVKTMVDDGAWFDVDVMYLFGGHTNDDGEMQINYINPGIFDVVQYNPIDWNSNGFKSDGVTTALDPEWSPGPDGINFKQDDASIGILIAENNNQHVPEYGVYGCTNKLAQRIICYPRESTDSFQARLNCTTISAVSNTDSQGWHTTCRNGSNFIMYKGGVEKLNITLESTGIPDCGMTICGYTDGDNGIRPIGNKRVKAYYAGRYLTNEKRAVIEDAINTYYS